MTALQIVLEQINARRAIFEDEPLQARAEDKQAILEYIESSLSPENLHADGNRSQAQARALSRQLTLAKSQAENL